MNIINGQRERPRTAEQLIKSKLKLLEELCIVHDTNREAYRQSFEDRLSKASSFTEQKEIADRLTYNIIHKLL